MTESADEPRVSQIEGRAIVHKAFGGAGVSRRKTPRESAHDSLMQCTDATGNPEPKCFNQFHGAQEIHSKDCDHATGLVEQLRQILPGG